MINFSHSLRHDRQFVAMQIFVHCFTCVEHLPEAKRRIQHRRWWWVSSRSCLWASALVTPFRVLLTCLNSMRWSLRKLSVRNEVPIFIRSRTAVIFGIDNFSKESMLRIWFAYILVSHNLPPRPADLLLLLYYIFDRRWSLKAAQDNPLSPSLVCILNVCQRISRSTPRLFAH